MSKMFVFAYVAVCKKIKWEYLSLWQLKPSWWNNIKIPCKIYERSEWIEIMMIYSTYLKTFNQWGEMKNLKL